MIITIGRQYGSGGYEIGKKLATDLGVELYDKEMLKRAAKESGLCEELFETHDEKPTNSFLYSLVMDTYSLGYSSGTYADMPINHKVFLAQFDAIKKIAEEKSCVIVGRCADYVLREHPNVVNVFICAPMEDKIKRAIEYYGIKPEKAASYIVKKDKKRKGYYNFYTDMDWGKASNYDLCINSRIGIEGCVDTIVDYTKRRFNLE